MNTPQTTDEGTNAGASATDNESHNNDKFKADQNEVNDGTTMITGERLGRDMAYGGELAMLDQENEMPIGELRAMYAGINDDN